jgi:hypothetical protein
MRSAGSQSQRISSAPATHRARQAAPYGKLEIGASVQIDQRVDYLPDLVDETISQKDAVFTKNLKPLSP